MYNHGLDPQRVDDTGRPVVHGKPWSECGTGIWMTVGITKSGGLAKPEGTVGSSFPIQGSLWLNILGSRGRLILDQPFWGTAIEIPSDLGDDELKQKYLTDWFIETVREAVLLSGGNPFTLASSRQEMVDAVEDAILGMNL